MHRKNYNLKVWLLSLCLSYYDAQYEYRKVSFCFQVPLKACEDVPVERCEPIMRKVCNSGVSSGANTCRKKPKCRLETRQECDCEKCETFNCSVCFSNPFSQINLAQLGDDVWNYLIYLFVSKVYDFIKRAVDFLLKGCVSAWIENVPIDMKGAKIAAS